ncbi:MAG: tRNA (adenosine(37)-N6)-threonylcarbamoyltransferase complex transferase subunit TsaD [Candidatus Curtissbacteria bacterium]|nr:tRNA (adenosine(37)-N6)-threonylcarbamoyltransferase complex transferase subunit TsaD [Candidatus Curtissbacteria bacterium]MDZ4209594.1 tRNA (adenosine(37)-N6)-threonylcarbamoyltransferase complex transferase subunit TsaD [Candidatus Curtissbacteria bacterium]
MIILGIETTCDETGVGIVRDGRQILANVVASSASMHQKYGGIVPEVAARDQIRSIIPALQEVFQVSSIKYQDLDAIAVANGPGLIGSLLIGVETAKTISLVFKKPLISINHLVAHIYANWIGNRKHPSFPLIALIVSGGHTDLILMTDHKKYRWLGGTLDDAAGEAFDKVARVLGLGYPGGPEIERVAKQFTVDSLQKTVRLPRPMISDENFDFSFSGLKTAVVNTVNSSPLTVNSKAEIAYEFQNAVFDVLVTKTLKAAKKYKVKSIVVGGGVSANSALRIRMSAIGQKNKFAVFFPPKNLSVDNGVMIAAAAYYKRQSNNPLNISAVPGLYF